MDANALLRKLEPLMPERVARWRRSRDIADPQTRILIDRHIAATVYQQFGNVREKILLSLPSRTTIRGPVNLGTVLYDGERWPAGISAKELLQNLAIFGRSGAGKTNAVFHVLEQLNASNVPFLFLDWKRTARHLLPHFKRRVHVYTPGRSLAPFPFNPLIVPPTLESHVYVGHIVDVLADAFTLGDGARSVLQRAISSCYQDSAGPAVEDVIRAIESVPDKERVRGWKISAFRALESLAFLRMSGGGQTDQEEFARRLLTESTIIELDSLSSSGKKFLIPLLSLWLYTVKLAARQREQLSFVLVVEEAHHVLYRHTRRAHESVLEMLMRQCREVGIAVIVVDQHPHLISTAVLGNTYTSLCLNLKDPRDIRTAASASLVDDSERAHFSRLPVGQAIVKLQDRWARPFLVQIPHVQIEKGAVTDAALNRYIGSNATHSGARRALGLESGRVQRIRMADHVLREEDVGLLRDVLAHPDDGIRQRYRRLGMSAGRGTRIKRELADAGWIEEAVVPVGRTRKTVLRLSRDARSALGLDGSKEAPTNESLTHEYWKRVYARKYQDDGYEVTIEAVRHGGRVDVLARRGDETVGIEIETGQSDVVRNVKNGLRSGFTRVLVVSTDERARMKVERQLGPAGLLIRGRVAVERAKDMNQSNLYQACGSIG